VYYVVGQAIYCWRQTAWDGGAPSRVPGAQLLTGIGALAALLVSGRARRRRESTMTPNP